MFIATEEIKQRLRDEVKSIMKGARVARNLRLPAYLGGDGVPLGKQLRSVQALLNPIDPVPRPGPGNPNWKEGGVDRQ
jgi:hypothetical protein